MEEKKLTREEAITRANSRIEESSGFILFATDKNSLHTIKSLSGFSSLEIKGFLLIIKEHLETYV